MSWIDGGYPAHERTDHRRSSDRVGAARAETRKRSKWIIPLAFLACYLLFAAAVQLRALDALDTAVRSASRPGDVWGLMQIRAARVVGWLQPVRLALPLLFVAGVLSLLRRSLRPLVVVAVVGVPAALTTLGTKWVMAHSGTDSANVSHGSFPSGHTVSAVVVVGLLLLLFRPRTRWGWMLPAVMGGVMGSALVLASFHPATDVLGAGLLAAAALTSASAAGLGQWAHLSQARSAG